MSDPASNNAPSTELPSVVIGSFFKAVRAGNDKAVAAMLDRYGLRLINVQNKYGTGTALLSAVWDGHAATVDLLLQRGADVDAVNERKRTALMLAAIRGNTAITEVLLKKGASLEARDGRDNTALMWAEFSQRTEVAELLRQWPGMQKQQAVESRIEKLKHLRPAKHALKNSANLKPRG